MRMDKFNSDDHCIYYRGQESLRRNGSVVIARSEVKLLSYVQLSETPRTVAYQVPPSMGFSRQEYWNELPFP